MKRIIHLCICVLALAAPAAAQDRTADVERAKADLQRAGVDLSGACGAAKITNLVAWQLRPQYGLLGKLGGYRAVLRPGGSCESGGAPGDTTRDAGVASDYLIERGTWHGYDLLEDGGGRNGAHWDLDRDKVTGVEDPGILARNASNFIAPIDPSVYMGAPATPGPVGPVVIPPVVSPQPAPLFDVAALQAQIAAMADVLNEHVRADGEAHASIAQNITDGRNENRSFFSAVGDHWKAITMIAGPFVTYGTCRVTGKC
jgi:hypothetical protein